MQELLGVRVLEVVGRKAQLTAAGSELLTEGRRLLAEVHAVANRVRRVASGWESQLVIGLDDVIAMTTVFEKP